MMWNASDQIYGKFDNGDYLRVQGAVQLYNGALQMIVNRFDKTPATEVDEADSRTGQDHEVAGVEVGVEEAVLVQHANDRRGADVDQLTAFVRAQICDRSLIGLATVEELHAQDAIA